MSLIQLGNKKTNKIEYFFQRFENGKCIAKDLPRITTQESEKLFEVRNEGLKVLLVNPEIRVWSMPNIEPMGQCLIGSSAKVDGHQLFVLDLNAERKEPVLDEKKFYNWANNRIIEEINRIQPDVIGVGGIISQYKRIKEIVAVCRQNSNAVIILGGGIATCMPHFMMQRIKPDIVSLEEGEITFSETLYRIERNIPLDGLQGTLFRRKNGDIVDNGKRPTIEDGVSGFDFVNWPLRSNWDVENVYKKNPTGWLNWDSKWKNGKSESNKNSLSIIGSKGCFYRCDFCYITYLGEAYRLRSPDELIDEMEYLKEKYNLTYIHFLDDLFLTKYRWALDFFQKLRERRQKTGFEILWGATCRTNLIADDILRAKREGRVNMIAQAHEVGMRQVCVGIESASPTILKNIDKSGQTPEKIALCVEEVNRVFGMIDPSFMIGSPGETRQTVQETVDFCLKHNVAVETIFYTCAFPGTPFFDLALEKGLIGKAVKGYKCEADDDIIEQYFEKLGENSEAVRTNFSDELSDEELVELGNYATDVLGSKNKRHPHSGEYEPKARSSVIADL